MDDAIEYMEKNPLPVLSLVLALVALLWVQHRNVQPAGASVFPTTPGAPEGVGLAPQPEGQVYITESQLQSMHDMIMQEVRARYDQPSYQIQGPNPYSQAALGF